MAMVYNYVYYDYDDKILCLQSCIVQSKVRLLFVNRDRDGHVTGGGYLVDYCGPMAHTLSVVVTMCPGVVVVVVISPRVVVVILSMGVT